MKLWVVGIDEAGRSPVIGPLIQVGLLCTSTEQINELKAIGVKDSKKLPPDRRSDLAMKILGICTSKGEFWTPPKINQHMRNGSSLNLMESIGVANIARDLFGGLTGPRYIAVHRIQGSGIPLKGVKIIQDLNPGATIEAIENEDFHPVVAAASIVATWLRTLSMQGIREKHPSIGSGEPMSPATRLFIKTHLTESWLPDIVRMKWITVKRIKGELK